MGAWGGGIFQDDFACDLKQLYTELLALGLSAEQISAELQGTLSAANGIDATTYWIALAILQHKFGRLEDSVRDAACRAIDSGAALDDWTALVEPGDSSIKARRKHLLKARAIIVSEPRPPARPRISREIRDRIDKQYVSYPWKEGRWYAVRLSSGEYMLFCACVVYETKLERHYITSSNGYRCIGRPVLPEVILLRLNYRSPQLPPPGQLSRILPFVRPMSAKERGDYMAIVESNIGSYRKGLDEDLDSYRTRLGRAHPGIPEAELRARYEKWTSELRRLLDLADDRERALERFFYQRFMIDPRLAVPEDRIVALDFNKSFPHENSCISATWDSLEQWL